MLIITDKLFFLLQFFRDRKVASLVPTSEAAIRKLCNMHLPTDRPVTLVEYGPGTGVFTKYLASYLHRDSHIIAIELNRELYQKVLEHSKSVRKGQCKISAIHGDALNVDDLLKELDVSQVDYFLSGIPFSFLEETPKMELLKKTSKLLRNNGGFLVYQVSYHVLPYLQRVFPKVSKAIFWRNVPPLYYMYAQKKP